MECNYKMGKGKKKKKKDLPALEPFRPWSGEKDALHHRLC